jgi:hypothetical protein
VGLVLDVLVLLVLLAVAELTRARTHGDDRQGSSDK